MTLRGTIAGACVLLLACPIAQASTTDILIGLDAKISYDPGHDCEGCR